MKRPAARHGIALGLFPRERRGRDVGSQEGVAGRDRGDWPGRPPGGTDRAWRRLQALSLATEYQSIGHEAHMWNARSVMPRMSKEAATTRKRRAAAKKAAITRKRIAAVRKAATARKRRAAARKAARTTRRYRAAKKAAATRAARKGVKR